MEEIVDNKVEDKKAAQPTPEEVLKKKIEELEKNSQKELQEAHNKWLYLYADFENYKKRIVKEKADLIRYGNELLAREIVEVIDHLEAALNHASGTKEIKALEDGIQLTLKKFLTVMDKFGIKPVDSVGQKFDPRFHEAIHEEEKEEVETGTIISEEQKGYTYHDRLLRVARVVVAKKKI